MHYKMRFLTLLLFLGGCSAGSSGLDDESLQREVMELTGPAPSANTTPMEPALACIAENHNGNRDLRIAVSDITDGSGARTAIENSNLLTQRPDLMFAVGLSKTGLRVINRSSTRVAEWELNQAMEQRLGEGRVVSVDGQEFPFRAVEAGSILGSTHYVTGALTEVNWNIRSSTVEGGVLGFATGARSFHISVAADLILTDTTTTEVVIARSYQKQIVGREVNRGMFRFFDVSASSLGPVELFDLSVGEQQNEPVQRAVRWLIEMAAYDIAATLTDTHNQCDPLTRVDGALANDDEPTEQASELTEG